MLNIVHESLSVAYRQANQRINSDIKKQCVFFVSRCAPFYEKNALLFNAGYAKR